MEQGDPEQEDARRTADSVQSAVFFVAFAFLFTHELDAVTQAEWRLLPLLKELSDETARVAFVGLHVPLVAGLAWLTAHEDSRLRRRSRVGIDVFLVLHAVLHWLSSDETLYTFHSRLSVVLIFGGAFVALLHLLLVYRHRRL